MLYDHKGFWVMQKADCDHLREQFRVWKAMQIEEKQSEAGKQTKNLKRGKTKAGTASGQKSPTARKKNLDAFSRPDFPSLSRVLSEYL